MLRRLIIIGAVLAAAGLAAYVLLWAWPMHDPHPAIRLGDETLVIHDATI
jgi:hypothetical protein